MKTKKSTGFIRSLDKGLFLLEVIEESGSPITLKKLWLKLHWDKATIHRLLATLERRGYICRDQSSKGYTLGMKIYGLYNSLVQNLDLQTITRPYLSRLVKATGETAHLAVPVEKNIVFIDRVAGSGILSVNTQLGGREPLHCTALGKAYLAYVDEEALATLMSESFARYTPKTIVSARSLREELARVLWNHLEQQPGALRPNVSKELAVAQETTADIVELWEQLGVITRRQEQNSYRLYFRSRLDAEVEGVCPTCGVRGRGRKELFLRPISCKKCGAEGYYHIKYTDPQ